ncbi:MAG: zinc ribbon domain-containing protein [Desulfobacteraceae bacterium]|nr:MAG: zinc ribbon domain-containing protein [Desulfobacteraceae bacterium]
MPIYEFTCTKCKNQFEYLVFGNDKDIACPDCQSKKVKRLMSACRHKSGGRGGDYAPAASSGGGCAGCGGGSCSTCH